MLKGFRDFIMRGNVIDLAVAVVVGGAFTALVTAFSAAIISPILAAIGGPDASGWGFQLVEGNDATFVNLGLLFTAAFSFLITAAVIYFVFVAPMNTYQTRRKAKLGAEEAEEVPEDVALLTQIRDLLARERGGTAGDDTSPGGSRGAEAP